MDVGDCVPFSGEGNGVHWVLTLHLGEEFAKGSYRWRESHLMGAVNFQQTKLLVPCL